MYGPVSGHRLQHILLGGCGASGLPFFLRCGLPEMGALGAKQLHELRGSVLANAVNELSQMQL